MADRNTPGVPASEKDRRVSDFIAGAAWHMANPDEPLGALQDAAESWATEHATAGGQEVPRD